MTTLPQRTLYALLHRAITIAIAAGAIHQASAQPGVSLYTIPVVFHVLHQDGTENIADVQIADAMAILNAYYDAPTVDIDPPFDTIVGDMDISFVLASVAPDGSPTTGIDRIETVFTNDAGAPGSYLNPWPRNRYLNIWTGRSLYLPMVSYMTKNPATADDEPCEDGIVIRNDYVGTIGTASFTARRTLTQAVGRFFNLKMLWEDPILGGPCADDDVADTPPCVPDVTCQNTPNDCSALPTNEHNFMYTPYCSDMFTLGQRARVHACINSPIAQRDELASGTWTASPACAQTGITASGNTASQLTAFPIPFGQRLFVRGLPARRCSAELRDAFGRTVLSLPTITDGQALELNGPLAAGSYVLVVNTGSSISCLRVVKE